MAGKEKIVLHTDGGSRGNPGIAGAGIVIYDSRGNVLKKESHPLGKITNNEAEYQAVIKGLEALKRTLGKEKLKTYNIEIRLDSELIANQLRGKYQLKEERLFPLFIKIWNMQVRDFPKFEIKCVPREKNAEADRLANQAMDAASPRPKLF